MHTTIRRLILIVLLWLLIAVLVAIQAWPDLPRTKLQWSLLVAFGPPLYVFGEKLFGSFFSRQHGHSVSPDRFSFKRILLTIPVVLLFLAFSWWLSWILYT